MGKVEKRNAHALLRDWVDERGGTAKFIVPMTKAHWNTGLAAVCDFAAEHNLMVEAVVDESTSRVKELAPYLKQVRKQHQAAAPVTKLVALLEAGRKPHLLVLWDDEDEDALQALMKADDAKIPMFDLARGMDPVLLTDDGEEEQEQVTLSSPEDDEADEEEELPGPEEEDEPDDEEELPEEPEEDEELPDFSEEEEEPLVLEDDEEIPAVSSTLTEFESRMLDVLERLADALSNGKAPRATRKAAKAPEAPKAAPSAPKAPRGTQKAPEAKKSAPAPKAPATKPARKAAPPKAAASNGEMSKAEAQRLLDSYVPRRGRPPAEITKARQVLGLIP